MRGGSAFDRIWVVVMLGAIALGLSASANVTLALGIALCGASFGGCLAEILMRKRP